MHKMGGRVTVLAVFAVLPTNYQRSTYSFSAEILGCRWFGDVKNSETARCSAAVFRCFVIQMLRIAKMALPVDPSLRPILDEIRMSGRYHNLT
jgi:hypothetical protein